MIRATTVLEKLKWAWIALLAVSAVQIALWAMDYDPPFKVISYVTEPVRVGGVLSIRAEVERDLDRDCYVELSSGIYDSTGARWDMGTTQIISPEALRELDARSPGKLVRKIQLPNNMAPGPAIVLSNMLYRCNPFHNLIRPISVGTRFDFIVLP